VKGRVKKSRSYFIFRRLRLFLHLSPLYQKFKSFFSHYFGGIYKRIDTHHVFLLAGGLSFSLFVCIIPFVLIIFAVLGTILNSSSMQVQVNTLIETIIPYSQYSDFVKEIIFSRIGEVIQYKNIAGLIGAIGLLFAASGLFSSMRTILNKVYGVEIELNVILAKLKDFALVLMVILLFFITTMLIPIIDVFRQIAGSWSILNFFQQGIFNHILYTVVSLVVIFMLFVILYFTVPQRKLGKRAIIMSALWASILWEAAKQIFGYYLYNFSSFGRIYGTYALVVVVAFWIYYSAVVFIIGAEIGRLYHERKYASQAGVI
ncbi:MAG: YihY/virulence factor BrkB family protein, partial [Ignavibacteriaceae bacterium]|nr:YihY/virulence factor BrkB family protein [Ignavibacteriaceae bacterium]